MTTHVQSCFHQYIYIDMHLLCSIIIETVPQDRIVLVLTGFNQRIQGPTQMPLGSLGTFLHMKKYNAIGCLLFITKRWSEDVVCFDESLPRAAFGQS